MSRVVSLCSLVSLFVLAGLPALARGQTLVRIVGRDPDAHHVITCVVGSQLVPYTRTHVSGNSVHYESGIERVSVYGSVCSEGSSPGRS